MHITYLTNLQENINLFVGIHQNKLEGLNHEEIANIENMYKMKLPTALKELYFLGGRNFFKLTNSFNYNGFGFMPIIFKNLDKPDIYKNFILDFRTRIILCIEDFDYIFINLYEGDNTPVYRNTYLDEDNFQIKKIHNSISDMVEYLILSINN